MARVALAWLLAKPWTTSVIIGAEHRAARRQHGRHDLTLTPEEIARLDEVSALPPEYPGWMVERRARTPPAAVRPGQGLIRREPGA